MFACSIIIYTDDLDIDPRDGTVYFTDAQVRGMGLCSLGLTSGHSFLLTRLTWDGTGGDGEARFGFNVAYTYISSSLLFRPEWPANSDPKIICSAPFGPLSFQSLT